VVGKMWEDEDGVVHVTRYRLDLCGKAPTSWGRRGAPAAPEERQQQYGAALRGHANRAADVRAAWTQQQQFPPLPRQTAQQPELQELQARIVKIEYKMEQFVAQGQAPASAAATPAQGEGNERERDLKQKVQELEGQVAGGKTITFRLCPDSTRPQPPEGGGGGSKVWGSLSYGGTPGTGPTPASGSVMSRVFGCSWAKVSLSCLCRQSRSGKSDSFSHLSLSVMPSRPKKAMGSWLL